MTNMIDVKDLRENPDKYRKGSELKGVHVEIARILDLESQRVAAQQEFERLRSEQNEASKQIGRLKDPAEKQAAIAKVGTLQDIGSIGRAARQGDREPAPAAVADDPAAAG
jgi:seryl-tRNA synthetase